MRYRIGDKIISTMAGWEGQLEGTIISYDYPPPDVIESDTRMYEVLLDEVLFHNGLVIGTLWVEPLEIGLVSSARKGGFSKFIQKVERDYA